MRQLGVGGAARHVIGAITIRTYLTELAGLTGLVRHLMVRERKLRPQKADQNQPLEEGMAGVNFLYADDHVF